MRELRGLIDGLGLDRPVVVGDGVAGPRLQRFFQGDPERLAGVVVVTDASDPAPAILRVHAAIDAYRSLARDS